MEHTEFRTVRPLLPGDAAYGPYNLALDPALMDRYMRQARVERAQVACDLVGGLWRSIKSLLSHRVPGHHPAAPISGPVTSVR